MEKNIIIPEMDESGKKSVYRFLAIFTPSKIDSYQAKKLINKFSFKPISFGWGNISNISIFLEVDTIVLQLDYKVSADIVMGPYRHTYAQLREDAENIISTMETYLTAFDK